MSECNVLYRFYSATGQLLYVGITMNPPSRFKAHRDSKEWWGEVSGITVENYDSRSDLERAERRAIQVERPLYNIVHNGKRKLSVVPNEQQPEQVRVITVHSPKPIQYKCDRCGRSVAKGSGYVHVSYDDIYAAEEHMEKCKNELQVENGGQRPLGGWGVYWNVSKLMEYQPACWQVHHERCDPDPDGNDYHFDVGRADTYEKLLSWSAHLLDKSWLRATNWGQFIGAQISPRERAV